MCDEIIRKIEVENQDTAKAYIYKDLNGDLQLSLSYKDLYFNFYIGWLEYKDQNEVDWLAQVILFGLKKAYENGVSNTQKEYNIKLSGLKELLTNI